jgi:hypothetical protein
MTQENGKQNSIRGRERTITVPETGILRDWGITVPVDGTTGYAPGCIFQDVDAGANVNFYTNNGTITSSNFEAIDTASASGTAAGRGASPAIWDNCPALSYSVNNEAGMHFLDDFIDGVDIAANTAVGAASALGTTGVFAGATDATAGSTVSTLATNSQGAVVLASTTDNESAMIAHPKGAAVAGKYKFTAGKKFWFETRIQVNSIGDAIAQLFVGFAEEALTAGGSLLLINEAGVADKDYVAFTRKYAASHGDILDTVFNTAAGGTTPIEIGADAVTLAAATWTKIGMYCDGTTLSFYQDGVLLADSVLIGATDFPIDEEMAFYAECMCGAAGADATMTLDWVRIAQEY